MTVWRTTTVRAVLCTLMLVSACSASGGGTAGDPVEPRAGCGECTRELSEMRAELDQLDGIGEVVTLHTYADSPTNGAGVKIELRSTGTGDTGIQDEVAEVVWRSRITPLDEVFVSVEDADGALVPTLPYDFTDTGPQHASYVEQWGPRPGQE